MLTILRHGRTEANRARLLQGRVDNPLDDLGHAQAQAAARMLSDADVVVSSPLERALQTAQAVADAANVDVIVNDQFVEIDYGEWEMKPLTDLGPEVWKAWRKDLDFRPPGGETLRELGERVRTGIETDVAPIARDSHVVLVCHVSPIKAAVAWALGLDDEVTWRLRVGQASICRIDVSGPTPSLVSFNEQHHLPPTA